MLLAYLRLMEDFTQVMLKCCFSSAGVEPPVLESVQKLYPVSIFLSCYVVNAFRLKLSSSCQYQILQVSKMPISLYNS